MVGANHEAERGSSAPLAPWLPRPHAAPTRSRPCLSNAYNKVGEQAFLIEPRATGCSFKSICRELGVRSCFAGPRGERKMRIDYHDPTRRKRGMQKRDASMQANATIWKRRREKKLEGGAHTYTVLESISPLFCGFRIREITWR